MVAVQDMIDTKLQERLAVFQEQIHALISQAVSPASGSASGGSHHRTTDTDSQFPASPSSVRSSKRKHKKKKKIEVLFLQD